MVNIDFEVVPCFEGILACLDVALKRLSFLQKSLVEAYTIICRLYNQINRCQMAEILQEGNIKVANFLLDILRLL